MPVLMGSRYGVILLCNCPRKLDWTLTLGVCYLQKILAGNGFLLDQFLHDNINQRTDQYGSSVENRSRLVLEVVDAVADVFGYQRIGVRMSPFSKYVTSLCLGFEFTEH